MSGCAYPRDPSFDDLNGSWGTVLSHLAEAVVTNTGGHPFVQVTRFVLTVSRLKPALLSSSGT